MPEIRIHDIYVTPEGKHFRFIRRHREDAYVIELGKSAATLSCIDWEGLRKDIDSGRYTTRPYQHLVRARYTPSEADDAKRKWRYSLIEPLINDPELFQRRGRDKLINDRASDAKVSPQTLRTCLAMWFQGGETDDSLLTNYRYSGKAKSVEPGTAASKKKRKVVSPDFVGPPSPFQPTKGRSYKTLHRSRPFALLGEKREEVKAKLRKLHEDKTPRTKTYRCVINELFSDKTGEWLPEHLIPSKKQIRDLRHEVLGIKEKQVERHGRAAVDNNLKPLLAGVLAHAPGAGYVYEVDSTKVDVWIVSRENRDKLIGKATLYFVVCRFSRVIVGFHLTLDAPSWAGVMEALISVVEDKKQLCAFWGAEYKPSTWVERDAICFTLVGDRGTEMVCEASEQVPAGLRLHFQTMPSQMSVLKGMVEMQFRLIHVPFRENLPGYELPQNIFARQKPKDYKKTASLTLNDLAVEVISFIDLHNNLIYEGLGEALDPGLSGVVPTPLNVWKADVERQGGLLRTMDAEDMRFILRPRKRVVVRREGILVNGCYYECEEARRDEWFERAAEGRFRIEVSYERRLVDYIWIHNPEWGPDPVKATLTPRSQMYLGWSVREVMLDKYERKLAVQSSDYLNERARAKYEKEAEVRIEKAKEKTAAAVAEHPGASRMSDRPEHRGAEASARAVEEIRHHAGEDGPFPRKQTQSAPVPPPPIPANSEAPPKPPAPPRSQEKPEMTLLSLEEMERIADGL